MHGLPKLGFEAKVIFGLGRQQGFTHNDHLRYVICFWFEQDRVHLNSRFHSSSISLDRLSATNLKAVCSHIRVVGHVLGLKGRNAVPILAEDATESRDQHTLSHMGCGALDH